MEALGVNLPGLIAQVFNFVLLLVILRLVLYKPVLRMLDKRSQAIRESLDKAEQVQQQAAVGEEEAKERLDEARRQAQGIIGESTSIAERVREDARTEARREGEALLARARVEIQHEREEAVVELRREFATLAILAAERVVDRSLDRQAHQDLIENALREATADRDRPRG